MNPTLVDGVYGIKPLADHLEAELLITLFASLLRPRGVAPTSMMVAQEMKGTRRVSRLAAQCVAAANVASGSRRLVACRFAGQVCIVTGAARGIGLAVVERLCREGARALYVFDACDAVQALTALAKAAPQADLGVKCWDLTESAQVTAAVAEATQRSRRVDVLVRAASTTGRTGRPTHEVEETDFSRVFDVNMKAVFLWAKAVLPCMLKEGYSRIVSIASISGRDGNAGMLACSSSTAALFNLTRVMAKDYAASGKDITVNCNSHTNKPPNSGSRASRLFTSRLARPAIGETLAERPLSS